MLFKEVPTSTPSCAKIRVMRSASITSHFKPAGKTLSFPSANLDRFRNQKGQAIVEYVLLIVIILSLAYGLARVFFEPLRNYGSGVFTNTIACALEYGQLPAEVITEDGCAAVMNAGTMGGGGGRGGGRGGRGGSGSSSSQGNQSKNKDSQQQDQRPGEESKEKSADAKGAGSNSNASGGASRPNTSVVNARGEVLKLGNGSGASEVNARSSEVILEGENYGLSDGGYSVLGRRRRRPVYKAVQTEYVDELLSRSSKSKRSEKLSSRTVASVGAEAEKKIRRVEVNAQREKKKVEVQEQSWDFAKILRIGLIVLMIIAILLFIFFQVAQIRKGSGSN